MARLWEYREEYDEKLIKHMEKGLSYESFAGTIGVSRVALYNWEKNFPSFKDAKDIGRAKGLLYWEELGVNCASGVVNGSSAVYIFTVKNRFPDHFKDKQEVEQTITKKKLVPQFEDRFKED